VPGAAGSSRTTTTAATRSGGLTAADERKDHYSEHARPTRNQARHLCWLPHDTFSYPERLRSITTNARFVPSKSLNGFVIAPPSKRPIVDGRQQSLTASVNAHEV